MEMRSERIQIKSPVIESKRPVFFSKPNNDYKKGDLVQVNTREGVMLCRVSVTYNYTSVRCNNTIYEGKALELHYVDADLNVTGRYCSWNGSNFDPIPKELWHRFIRKTSKEIEQLSERQHHLYRVLSQHGRATNISNSKLRKRKHYASTLDRMLLEEGEINIINQINTLSKKQDCETMIDTFGGSKMNVFTILAHWLGKLIATEVASWNKDGKVNMMTHGRKPSGYVADINRGKSLLKNLSQTVESPLNQVLSFNSPILSALLGTIASTKHYPNQGEFTCNSKSDPGFNKGKKNGKSSIDRRVKNVLSAFAMMQSSTSDHQIEEGPAFQAIETGLMLMLEKKGGVRDSVLNDLKTRGIAVSG